MEYPRDELAARRANPRRKKPGKGQFSLGLRCSHPGCILALHGADQIHITAAAAKRAFAEAERNDFFDGERWGPTPTNDLLAHLKASTAPATRKPPKRRNPTMAKRRRNPESIAWRMAMADAARPRTKAQMAALRKRGTAILRAQKARARGQAAPTGYRRGSEMTAAQMREGAAAYAAERQLAAVKRKPKRKRKPAVKFFDGAKWRSAPRKPRAATAAPASHGKAAARRPKKGSKKAPHGHRGRAAARGPLVGKWPAAVRKRVKFLMSRGFSTASITKAVGGKKKGGKKGGKKTAKKTAARARKLRAITPKFLKYAQHRKGVKKHLRARVAIKAKRKVAGLLVLNPRTGAVMSRVTVANPRKKHHARRARNPVGTAVRTVKAQILPMGAGAAAGFVAGYVDTKWLSDKPLVSVIGKIVMGVAGAYLIAKKHPSAAAGWAGGALGATGYQQGVKFGGGHVALSGLGALQGVADMAADDPEMANLIADLSDENDGMGDAADDYSAALGDEDNVQDIVTDE